MLSVDNLIVGFAFLLSAVSPAAVASYEGQIEGGVLKVCRTEKVISSQIDDTASNATLRSTLNKTFSMKIKDSPFPANDIWSFDGQSGRVFLNNGLAAEIRFDTAQARPTVKDIQISCAPVQAARSDAKNPGVSSSNIAGYDKVFSQTMINGDEVALYASRENDSSKVFITGTGKAPVEVISSTRKISAISAADGIDSPLKTVDVLAGGSEPNEIVWSRFDWVKR